MLSKLVCQSPAVGSKSLSFTYHTISHILGNFLGINRQYSMAAAARAPQSSEQVHENTGVNSFLD
jgi:hypothetical protein